jgi:opacity protein-like surface antigen
MNRRGDTDQYVSSDESMGKYTNEYNDTVHLELDWMVSVIGRAGWLATPTTLLYGLGGWSYAHFDVEDVPYDFGLGKLQDFHANGPTVGGGIEQKLSPKWSLRAEYRYTDFGKHSFSTNSRTTDKDSSSDGRSSKGSFGDGRHIRLQTAEPVVPKPPTWMTTLREGRSTTTCMSGALA